MIVKPITGLFGARITDIDLSVAQTPEAIDSLSSLLAERKVLAFPDQVKVGPSELLDFASCFGEPEMDMVPTRNGNGRNNNANFGEGDMAGVKILRTDGLGLYRKQDDTWHTDGSTRQRTSWLSFLQAVDVPEYGRDTAYADMEAVYDHLSERVQRFLEGMTALYSWGAQNPDAPPVEHPILVTNPKTDRKALYVNRLYTRSIVGVSADESQWILEYLFKQVHRPEHQLRLSWNPGTIVVWDNERTQHYPILDYEYDRIMYRVMVLQ